MRYPYIGSLGLGVAIGMGAMALLVCMMFAVTGNTPQPADTYARGYEAGLDRGADLAIKHLGDPQYKEALSDE